MSPEIQTSSRWIGWIKRTANCGGYLVASVPHTTNGARALARVCLGFAKFDLDGHADAANRTGHNPPAFVEKLHL